MPSDFTTTPKPWIIENVSYIAIGAPALLIVIVIVGVILCKGCEYRSSFLRRCCRAMCSRKKKEEKTQLPLTSTAQPSASASSEQPASKAPPPPSRPTVSPAAATPAKPTAVAASPAGRPMTAAEQAAAIEGGLERERKDDESIDDHPSEWGKTQAMGGKTGATTGVSAGDNGETTNQLRWKK